MTSTRSQQNGSSPIFCHTFGPLLSAQLKKYEVMTLVTSIGKIGLTPLSTQHQKTLWKRHYAQNYFLKMQIRSTHLKTVTSSLLSREDLNHFAPIKLYRSLTLSVSFSKDLMYLPRAPSTTPTKNLIFKVYSKTIE